jgi:hypothetical protein
MYKHRVVKNVAHRIGWCNVAVVILALLVGCGIPPSIRESRTQAESFVSALVAGNFTDAASMVVPSQRGYISEAYLRMRWKQLEQVIGKSVSATPKRVKISKDIVLAGGTASTGGHGKLVTFTYIIRGKTDREAEVLVTLTQQGGSWVVIDVTFSY